MNVKKYFMKKIIFIILLLPLTIFGQWTQIGEDINGEASGDFSGMSVHLSTDGTVLAIGAEGNDGNGNNSGHVRVFRNIVGSWTQIGSDLNGEAPDDLSGKFISISSDGNIVAIGARANDGNGSNSGHVRVYENIGDVWTQIGVDIDGEAVNDFSGYSVSLNSNGSIVAIGAVGNDGNGTDSGHVRVYRNIVGTWTQIGTDINGEAAGDRFGESVKLSSDGTILASGASGNDGNGSRSGHVRVYKNIGDVWTQIGDDIDGEAPNDYSGGLINLNSDGTILAIGAIGNDGNGNSSGHVRVYENIAGVWIQIGQDIDGENPDDSFSSSLNLSADGSIIAIGADGNDGNGSNSGRVQVYENIAGVWVQIGQNIDGEAAEDVSGAWSIGLSADGTIIAIGAFRNDGNGSSSGHVRVYNYGSLSISEHDFAEGISLYPNPSFGVSKIQLNSIHRSVTLSVFDVFGKLISTNKYNNINEITLNMQNYSKGMYIINVTSDSNQAILKWIIK